MVTLTTASGSCTSDGKYHRATTNSTPVLGGDGASDVRACRTWHPIWCLRGAAPTLVATLFLTGFGAVEPLSHAQYERHFDAAASRLVDVGADVEAKPYPTTEVGKIRRFAVARRLLQEAIADLTGISPPPDAKSDNATMIASFREFALFYQHVIADLRAGNEAAGRRASSTMAHSPQNEAFGRAFKDLESKGYKFHYVVARPSS